jgi:hypothetical protein
MGDLGGYQNAGRLKTTAGSLTRAVGMLGALRIKSVTQF